VNLSALDAPYLIAIEPKDPPTINELIDRLNKEHVEPIRAWEADKRPKEVKGR
jgi:hypothetical protein